VVKHFGAKAWSWPRGKINENESEEACAVREVSLDGTFRCLIS
jgi:predicted NUDIX family NTP pyrophosphohydrolase